MPGDPQAIGQRVRLSRSLTLPRDSLRGEDAPADMYNSVGRAKPPGVQALAGKNSTGTRGGLRAGPVRARYNMIPYLPCENNLTVKSTPPCHVHQLKRIALQFYFCLYLRRQIMICCFPHVIKSNNSDSFVIHLFHFCMLIEFIVLGFNK